MRLLLDTHFLIWLATDRSKIDPDERKLLEAPEHDVMISAASIWEIRIKWRTLDRFGARKRGLNPRQAIIFAEQAELSIISLHAIDCATALRVPITHRDPFDEMLLVHTQQLGAHLLTRDRLLTTHPLAWSP